MHGYSTGAVRWSDSHFPGTSYRYKYCTCPFYRIIQYLHGYCGYLR